MALNKKLVNSKGIALEYHRIGNITATDKINVVVHSYTDQSYRQMEKENEQKIDEQEALQNQLKIEMDKTGDDYNKDKVIELTDKINALGHLCHRSLSVLDTTFEFTLNKNEIISYASIYDKLKKDPMFEGATDVKED